MACEVSLVKTIPVLVLILLIAALPALAAEPGREAEIHMLDGVVRECVILGYADGEFTAEEAGKEVTIRISDVRSVVFGDAVGDFVRNPFDPPQPGERGPEAPAARRERPLEQIIASLDMPQTVAMLGRWTGRFGDGRRIERTAAGLERMLAEHAEPGRLNRNLKLGLVALRLTRNDTQTAEDLFAALKRDYPDDAALQKARLSDLGRLIERAKRPRGRFRRPPGSRRFPEPDAPAPK